MGKRIYTHDELFPPYSDEMGGVMQVIRQKDDTANTIIISAHGQAAELWEEIFEWMASNLESERAIADQKMSGSKFAAKTVARDKRLDSQ